MNLLTIEIPSSKPNRDSSSYAQVAYNGKFAGAREWKSGLDPSGLNCANTCLRLGTARERDGQAFHFGACHHTGSRASILVWPETTFMAVAMSRFKR